MSDDISATGKQIGETHWIYIEELLRTHDEDEKVIKKIKFHYIQAMKHGFKHGIKYEKEKKTSKMPALRHCGTGKIMV